MPLVDDIGTPQKAPASPEPAKAIFALPTGVTALVGILIGIVLCLLVYIAFLTPRPSSIESPNKVSESTATSTVSAPLNQIAAKPLPSPDPTAEESPSPEEPEVSAEAAPAALTEESPKMEVNRGPISTGTTTSAEARTVITMKDGSSVEAEAAWEDAEGIWFRRSGLVSFVERAKVEKVTEVSSRNNPTEAKP